MERRDWSLNALKELRYSSSLETSEKAEALNRWFEKYLSKNDITSFDLEQKDLEELRELFFTSINFLKNHKEELRVEMLNTIKLKRFLNNSL